MSAWSLRRYQHLLERVSRGELKPDEIQKQFRDYLQEQAGATTREAVELSVGLLAGLLYAEAKYREAMLDGLLPPADTVPPPPSPSGIDLTNWFQALATYAAEQSARGTARHQQLVERVASGAVSAARVQEHTQQYLQTHAPEFLAEVMDLGLTCVGNLQRSSSTLAAGLYDRVLGPDDHRPSGPEPPIVLELRGPSGSLVSSTVVVENTRPETADITCRVSEFTARAFGRRFRAPIAIDPPRFSVASGGPQGVALRLTLESAAPPPVSSSEAAPPAPTPAAKPLRSKSPAPKKRKARK